MNVFDTVVGVVGGLALFLFGMKVMSDGLQKVAGARMRKILKTMTSNRLLGVATGIVVTGAVQSSSATTVMLVGFVHAGLITLTQSVGVIMGANIGTTVTGWLVSILGFKIQITAMSLPCIALGFFARFLGSRRVRDWGEVLLGFGLLFLGLDFMKEAVGHLRESEAILAFMSKCRADQIGYRFIAVLVGMAFTFIVQSSSAALAVTMALVAKGMIDLPTACALAIGQNIGTTITANLAAIGTSTVAKQAARAHLLFNVLGSIWPFMLFSPFLILVDQIVPGDAFSPGVALSEAAITAHLAAFHTLFNVINAAIFLPFTTQLARLAEKFVRGPVSGEKPRLKYLYPRVLASAPMALHAARNELKRMLDDVDAMLTDVLTLISSADRKFDKKIADRISETEQTVDMLEKEITEYLVSVARLETSFEQSREITGIINAVSDLERIGDHCESLLNLARRLYDEKRVLTPGAVKQLEEIGGQARTFLALLKNNVFSRSRDLMKNAHLVEETIDEMRRQMREDHVERLNDGRTQVGSGLIFIDMLTSFEKIGDHSYNVAQMLAGER